jgi:hypothetical protein
MIATVHPAVARMAQRDERFMHEAPYWQIESALLNKQHDYGDYPRRPLPSRAKNSAKY